MAGQRIRGAKFLHPRLPLLAAGLRPEGWLPDFVRNQPVSSSGPLRGVGCGREDVGPLARMDWLTVRFSPSCHSEPKLWSLQTDPVPRLAIVRRAWGQLLLCYWFSGEPQGTFLIPISLGVLIR